MAAQVEVRIGNDKEQVVVTPQVNGSVLLYVHDKNNQSAEVLLPAREKGILMAALKLL